MSYLNKQKCFIYGLIFVMGTVICSNSFAGGVNGGNSNSEWTIYAWQNYSYDFIDNDDRDFHRMAGNAAHVGFAAQIDTGMSMGGAPIKATFRCEQFTFFNQFTGNTFCTRNSKIGLAGAWGEIMFANWLTPFNEMVAQWIDPWYDADLNSHATLMGQLGSGGAGGFYSPGDFDSNGGEFRFTGVFQQTFNRRQEDLIQYWSPNINGFNFRAAMTTGNRNETGGPGGDDLDPLIWSTGLSYTNGPFWAAVTYEQHDEWSAVELVDNQDRSVGADNNTESNFGIAGLTSCTDSDDSAWRIAANWTQDWGNGMSTRIAGMYEDMEFETECNVVTFWDDVERDGYYLSLKHVLGNGWDIRASYAHANELDCGGGFCAGVDENDTGADQIVVGVAYTMPAGTELRLAYGMVDNEDNANYDVGINGAQSGTRGDDIDYWSIGIVQWF